MNGNCWDCDNFPCIEDMKSNPNRKYWASLIRKDGCQSFKKKRTVR